MADSNKINYSKSFAISILLNALFVCVELIYGFKANSIALIADAIHKASDVIGLSLIWFSYYIANWKANYRFTFGFKKATIIVAFVNSIILFFAIGNLFIESATRLLYPEKVVTSIIIGVSMLGILVNSTTALLFIKDRKKDINMLTTFLNMSLDTLISLSVVIGGIFMWWRGWFFIDSWLGIIIASTIIFNIWRLFKESLILLMHGVPTRVNLREIIQDINNFNNISSYQNLHVWALSTTEIALCVHIKTTQASLANNIVSELTDILREKHNIENTTIQLEIIDTETTQS